jgi:Rieske Fe-S protein
MEQNRREFLGTVAVASAAVSTIGLLRPAAAVAAEEVVAVLGKAKDLNESAPTFVKADFKDSKGQVVESGAKFYVRWDKGASKWVVLSAICTHLKCKIDVSADKSKFQCPCHKSEFTLSGKVTKKPAKKDLPNFSDQAYEEDGMLKLKKAAPKAKG